jgi:hypothetical protein
VEIIIPPIIAIIGLEHHIKGAAYYCCYLKEFSMSFKKWSQAQAAAADAKPGEKAGAPPPVSQPAVQPDRAPEQPMGVPPAQKS